MGKLRTDGFTLIEVLISVLILAVGVVGAARMQLSALRASQQSAYQTAALQLAAEMAEKIRANQPQSTISGIPTPFLQIDYESSADSLARPSTTCYSTDCHVADLSTFDIYEWEARVNAVLPGGRVKICRDSMPWDRAAEAFAWSCTANVGSTDAPFVIKIGWHGKGAKPDGRINNDPVSDFPPSIALAVESYAG